MPRHCPPRWTRVQQRAFPPLALCCRAVPQDSDLLRLLLSPPPRLRLRPATSGDSGCGPLPAGALPCSPADCPSMPLPLRRRGLRGCASRLFPPSLAFASRDRLGALLSLAGEHLDAAGCTSCCGLPVCTSVSEGYSASAPQGTPEHWEPATWRSGAYHGRTCTGEQTVTFKAHHALVRGWVVYSPAK
jgi:hypothetical protein